MAVRPCSEVPLTIEAKRLGRDGSWKCVGAWPARNVNPVAEGSALVFGQGEPRTLPAVHPQQPVASTGTSPMGHCRAHSSERRVYPLVVDVWNRSPESD